MNRAARLFRKWKTEYDIKTYLVTAGSLAANLAFACYNAYLRIRLSSLWHDSICVYYLVMLVLRGTVVAAAGRLSSREDADAAKNRICLTVSWLLLLLNVCLVVPMTLMVLLKRPAEWTIVPAIVIATYTTYSVAAAAVNLRTGRKSKDPFVPLLRTIAFIGSLVSVLTLQNTLIMAVAGEQSREMLALTAVTSGAVWIAVLIISVLSIVRAARRVRGT